jgi:PAS domain S-box-containing protein
VNPPRESLRELRERLACIQRLQRATGSIALAGGFEIDCETRTVVWSPQVRRIHGLALDQEPNLERWFAAYRPRYRSRLREAVERALGAGDPWDLELQIVSLEGKRMWVRCQGRAERDGERVVRVYGAMQDITEHKLIEQHLNKTLAEVDEARRSSEHQAVQLARQAAELALAREAAEEAARMKSAFLATMSHEIRTPLNGVLGMVSLLDGTSLSQEQREYLDTIRVSGESLLDIINDVLDFSKNEAGKARLLSTPFDLARCCEEAADILAAKAAAKRLELSVFVAPACPLELVGDAGRLRQVLVNLIGNALKFTEAGQVALSVEPKRGSDGGLRFEVRDTGIGIARNVLPSLFHPFIQADNGATRRFGGTGLGLAICKQIVEAMGGTIGATSRSGEGATFWFELNLPVAKARESEDAAPFAGVAVVLLVRSPGLRAAMERYMRAWGVRVVVKDTVAGAEQAFREDGTARFLLAEAGVPHGFAIQNIAAIRSRFPEVRIGASSWPGAREVEEARAIGLEVFYRPAKRSRLLGWLAGRSLGPRPSEPKQPSGVSRRILVAEDNPVNQRIVLKMLQRLGHDATIAGNGQEALDRLHAEAFDLILMDCQMPEMDGYQATREIRRRSPAPPIVALTANALEGDRQRCLDAGMDDYLTKPIDLTALDGMIERWARPAARQSV